MGYGSRLLRGKEISHSYTVVHPTPDKRVFGTYSGSLIKCFKIRHRERIAKEILLQNHFALNYFFLLESPVNIESAEQVCY